MVFYSNSKNNNFIDIQAWNMKLKNRPFLCKNYLKIPQEKSEYLNVSDEAYFYLTNRICDIKRPTDGIKPLHSEKLLFFFAISATTIYGPYYFSTSVNQHNYLKMLKVWFWPSTCVLLNIKNIIFSKMGPLLIHIIMHKSGWPRNLVKNSLLRVHGQHGQQTSTHVTPFMGIFRG